MRRTSESLKWLSWCSVLVLSVLVLILGIEFGDALADERPTNPETARNTFEVLSYQDSGYRFKVIGAAEEPPSGFEQPGFDETGFDVGNAAFGGGGGGAIGGADCPLRATVQAPWPLESQLLVRRFVSIPAGATGVRVMVSVDNDIGGVFFNGTRIADFTSHGECPIRDEFRFDVPQELVLPGNNLVAFHLVDRPLDVGPANESFFDTRILAELAPDQLANAVDVQQASLVPVSDVTLDCRTDPFKERTSTTISYVVAGTEQLGEITVEQSTPRGFTVESLLDGKRMALGTITPNKATVLRSPRATRRLANLDAGVLSVGSVLPNQTALEGLFRCIATPAAAALSCETTCDLKAARSSAIASILEGFT
ncbi:MAG: hypothetical protein ACREBC_18375, partial [Pyrinomonadaceae bacterium]